MNTKELQALRVKIASRRNTYAKFEAFESDPPHKLLARFSAERIVGVLSYNQCAQALLAIKEQLESELEELHKKLPAIPTRSPLHDPAVRKIDVYVRKLKGEKIKDLAKEYGVSVARVSDDIRRIGRMLDHPSRRKAMMDGVDLEYFQPAVDAIKALHDGHRTKEYFFPPPPTEEELAEEAERKARWEAYTAAREAEKEEIARLNDLSKRNHEAYKFACEMLPPGIFNRVYNQSRGSFNPLPFTDDLDDHIVAWVKACQAKEGGQ